jgi:DNA replication initiation complex subunit (GINS family)
MNEELDGMPKRQLVGMEKEFEKKIEKIIQKNLDSLLKMCMLAYEQKY